MKKLYLINYESAQWCGGDSHCVARAYNCEYAVDVASEHMDTEMLELFSDEIEEEYGEDGLDEQAYIVISVEEFGPEHKHWKWFNDETQSQFYPVIGNE